ncbi:hypothetical protein ACSMXN_09180 [Jatrophihabitans sp. DSM 45814]
MQLVKTARGYVEVGPLECANGHRYRGGRVLVGWHPCECAGGNGHRTHECRECGDVRYNPPHIPGAGYWEAIG